MNIRNRNILVALVGLGILGASSISNADYSTTVAQPLRVDIGGFFPTDSTVQSTLRRTALYGGVSYDIANMGAKSSTPTVGGVYVDASYNSSGGIHATIVGAGVQARVSAGGGASMMGTGNAYFGAGIGAYFVNTTGLLAASNHTELGGKLFLGYELTQGFFIEGGYTYISPISGIQPGGFTAVVGYKF